MSDGEPERVKCLSCDRMPLASTARAKDGLCGVCYRDRAYRELQLSRERFLSNPPSSQEEIDELAPPGDLANLGLRTFLMGIRRPLLDPKAASPEDVEREVRLIARKYSSDRSRAVSEFMHLCEPFTIEACFTQSIVMKIPSPYREMYALLCAWGTVENDDLGCYAENYPHWWDSEVDKALQFFGFEQSCGALGEARRLLQRSGGELPEQADDELSARFTEPLSNFDRDVLGAFLQRLASEPGT